MSPPSPNHFNIYQTEGIDIVIAVEPDSRWYSCCMDAKIIIEPRNFVYYSNALKVDTGQWNTDDIKRQVDSTITKVKTKSGIIANSDKFVTTKGSTITILPSALLANDVDNVAGTLQVSEVKEPISGTVAMTKGKNSKITFTPFPGFTGKASFKYTATNGTKYDIGIVNVEVTSLKGVITEKNLSQKNKLLLNNNVYIEGCSFARVAANMTLITQVINYFWDKCNGVLPNVTTYIEVPSIPINYTQHKYYDYVKWMNEWKEKCKTKC